MTEQLEQLVVKKLAEGDQFPFPADTKKMDEAISVEVSEMVAPREGKRIVCYVYQTAAAPDPENGKYAPFGDIHNRTNDVLMAQFGVHSRFAEEQRTYMRPFIIDERVPGKTIATAALDLVIKTNPLDGRREFVELNAERFQGTGRRVGGFFCYEGIAEEVIVKKLTELGYQIR